MISFRQQSNRLPHWPITSFTFTMLCYSPPSCFLITLNEHIINPHTFLKSLEVWFSSMHVSLFLHLCHVFFLYKCVFNQKYSMLSIIIINTIFLRVCGCWDYMHAMQVGVLLQNDIPSPFKIFKNFQVSFHSRWCVTVAQFLYLNHLISDLVKLTNKIHQPTGRSHGWCDVIPIYP